MTQQEKKFREELAQVATFLETTPPKDFDMMDWDTCILGLADRLGFYNISRGNFMCDVYRYVSDTWNWLFSSRWYAIDNSVSGAAKRIRMYLRDRVPSNVHAILWEGDPLPY